MIGKNVSHYHILEKIGSGGMGEIYLAEDTKLKRQIALKFLPRQMTADPEARTRFEREAQAAAALNHPNIVTVYEIGEHEGQVFIAMEYVEGRTLKELISGSVGANNYSPLPITHHPLPIAQVSKIAAQIAEGLAAAHAKGIVHRDIKPQNVMVEKDGRVKILDFGLAKLKGANPLTQESFAMGTVHYMSPEQGIGREVDPRSDIWSLGVVLYQLVSGELPFHGEYDQAVIYAIMNEDTPPLGVEAVPGGAGMENIIRRCLAKKRQDRYPSAEALAAALRSLGAGNGAPKPEPGTGRRRFRPAFLTVVSLLFLSGLLGFFALSPKATAALQRALGLDGMPRTRHMAVLPLVAGGNAEAQVLADGFTAVIIDKLTWLEKFNDSLWTVSAGESFRNRGKSPHALQRLWGNNLSISGEVQTDKNNLRLRLKLADARTGRELNAVEILGHLGNLSLFQDGLIVQLHSLLKFKEDPEAGNHANSGGTAMPGAYVLFLRGKGLLQGTAGLPALGKAIVLLEKALEQDNGFIQARLALVEALTAKFKLKRDPAVLQKALEQGLMAKAAAGPWAPARLAWALLLRETDGNAKALAALREVLRLDERCYQGIIELAKACSSAGRANEAEKLYQRAVSLRPGYPGAVAHLGYFYLQSGRLDEALGCYQKMAELAPGDFSCYNNIGTIFLLKGDKANAKAMFEKSNVIEPNGTAQSNLATHYFFEGAYLEALPLYQAAAATSNDYWLWGNLADTLRQLPGQQHEARAAYMKAIALAEARRQAAPEDANPVSCLALYYAHCGEKAAALAAIARARALAPADLETIRRAVLVHEAVQERSLALVALREYRERLGSLEEIEKEPDLDSLRRDPAFQEIAGDRQ